MSIDFVTPPLAVRPPFSTAANADTADSRATLEAILKRDLPFDPYCEPDDLEGGRVEMNFAIHGEIQNMFVVRELILNDTQRKIWFDGSKNNSGYVGHGPTRYRAAGLGTIVGRNIVALAQHKGYDKVETRIGKPDGIVFRSIQGYGFVTDQEYAASNFKTRVKANFNNMCKQKAIDEESAEIANSVLTGPYDRLANCKIASLREPSGKSFVGACLMAGVNDFGVMLDLNCPVSHRYIAQTQARADKYIAQFKARGAYVN